MKKFMIDLFSNRFGIVLAALNVCYLASKGELFVYNPLGKFFLGINVPAICSTVLSLEILTLFTGRQTPLTEYMMGNTFFVIYIVLQWLAIAWLAQTLARKIRPTQS